MHLDVVLLREQIEEAVGVGHETARDPDAGDVGDVRANRGEVSVDAFASHLRDETIGGFHATGDVLDRVVVVQLQELVPQNLDFRLDLFQPELVRQEEPLYLVPRGAQLRERDGHLVGFQLRELGDCGVRGRRVTHASNLRTAGTRSL